MNRFVGRQDELESLKAALESVRATGSGQLVWLFGRRRVGKSRLAQEFCDREKLRNCFFQGQRREREWVLAEFADVAAQSSLAAADSFSAVRFNSWRAALGAAARDATRDDPAAIIIDELPYIADADSGFATDLQAAWDRELQGRPVVLIAVGSDTRMMEALIAARAPMHGRPTMMLRVEPLDPLTVGDLTGAGDAATAIDRYLVVGGLPELARHWPGSVDLTDGISEMLASEASPLVSSALHITAAEFEGEIPARRVLEAIGHGNAAHNRIADRSGVSGRTLALALEALVDGKRLVTRSLPYGNPPGKKAPRYTVTDPYLRFWLRFIGPHLPEIERGRPDLVLDRIKRGWPTYRGRAIEPLAREALERLLVAPEMSTSLGGARHVGGWWRRDNSIEVDLVGGDAPEPRQIGFIGSVKWRENAHVGAGDAEELVRRRADVPGADSAALVMVTRMPQAAPRGIDLLLCAGDLLAAWRPRIAAEPRRQPFTK